jgi:hypothetical protein
MQKMEYVKQLLKQTIKSNGGCCCAKDGSFECRNCKLVSQMQAPRESACVNCFEV